MINETMKIGSTFEWGSELQTITRIEDDTYYFVNSHGRRYDMRIGIFNLNYYNLITNVKP